MLSATVLRYAETPSPIRQARDLLAEQPMKVELVVNLKTAKQIGLTIPQSMLYRADKVIK